jgi:microfibrillar-associated protein 1
VRELGRLLQAQDLREALDAEKTDYERRRGMTDEERLREDEALGLYKRPGEQRHNGADQGNSAQRYYHRGAFYMDEGEWSKDDVRHKAKDYERSATGDDKIDKRNLPKVMQVRNFGLARQNTKYKGLAHEDTTDKKGELLPLMQKKRRRNDKS